MKKYKKNNGTDSHQEYLKNQVAILLPILMDTVTQRQDGYFVFAHEKFPEIKVEGITLISVEEGLERVIKRQFKNQSNAHVDYLCKLLRSS